MKIISLLTYVFLLNLIYGQENLTLKQTEELFIKNNLELLAYEYQISNAEAKEIQAKIWELPYINAEINLINPQNNTYFDSGKKGQKAIAIQQLIYLGGKKRKEVDFAKSNTILAKLYFEQLLNTLKLELNKNFYSLFFNNLKLESLNNQINKVEKLVDFYSVQISKGNVPLKDVVRLQSLLLNLKNDYNLVTIEILDLQKQLKLLTGTELKIQPNVSKESLKNFERIILKKDSIFSTALNNNIDLKITKQIIENQALQLEWQKSLATPDLSLGLSYDQRGGAFGNQINLTLAMPLRIKNQNKGNIKIAENELSTSKIDIDIQRNEITSQLDNLYVLWEQFKDQIIEFETNKFNDIELVNKGMIENFERKNISLIEFSDFMESYNLSIIQLNEVKKQWVLTCLEMNYLVNNTIFDNK